MSWEKLIPRRTVGKKASTSFSVRPPDDMLLWLRRQISAHGVSSNELICAIIRNAMNESNLTKPDISTEAK